MEFRKWVRDNVPVSIRLSRFYFYYYSIMLRNFFFAERSVPDCKDIPIIINNFNRYTMLRQLIECLEKRGYNNIHVIDNASTYPPLLEYYKSLNHNVFRLDKNMGHLSFTKSGIYKRFKNRFFVYTDSDILLPEACPDDILEHFYDILTKTPYTGRVGCALRIDDIPDYYTNKKKVIEMESHFWDRPIGEDKYLADIDTTFALYRPNIKVGVSGVGKSIRVGGKYVGIHSPWYVDSKNLSEEENYYLNSASKNSTYWTSQMIIQRDAGANQ